MRLLARAGGLAACPLRPPCRALSTTAALPAKVNSKTTKAGSPKRNTKPLAKLAARPRSDSAGVDPGERLRRDPSKTYTGRHGTFWSITLSRFGQVLKQVSASEFATAGVGEDELDRQAAKFMDALDRAFYLAEQHVTQREKNPLFWSLREAFISKDVKGLAKELQYAFQAFLIRQRFTKDTEKRQQQLLDFRHPHEWYPATRALQRTIHVHVGPTNSGKTYHALQALESSRRGVYAGPLRLLATEVYQRLNAKGLPCALLTGEEVRIPENTDDYFTSCTVEMVPLNKQFDVAVVDEIQMLADPDRGSAWTQALLGVNAKEVHVCGEERAVSLLQSMCASIGDECVVHRYERLSPLETMDEALGDGFDNLRKGDAVVAFSRLQLHMLKRKIETQTGRRCAIVYGSLPPEVRVQQAALFNDPDNDYDFIVASDAIGMGLNLEIRRVIMESIAKFDGTENRLLTHPEIKQIGGRAGRYRTARSASQAGAGPDEAAAAAVGYVTTLDKADLNNVRHAFRSPAGDIRAAVIQAPPGIIERFAAYFPPQTPLSYLLMRIKATAATAGYQLSLPTDWLAAADAIQDIPLPISDRLVFSTVPVNLQAEAATPTLRALARIISNNGTGDLLSIPEIPLEILDEELHDVKDMVSYLYRLESLHMAITQYLWLSYRYVGAFRNRELAFHVRDIVQARLIDSLERLDFTEVSLTSNRLGRRRRAEARRRDVDSLRSDAPADEGEHETDNEPLAEPLGVALEEPSRELGVEGAPAQDP